MIAAIVSSKSLSLFVSASMVRRVAFEILFMTGFMIVLLLIELVVGVWCLGEAPIKSYF